MWIGFAGVYIDWVLPWGLMRLAWPCWVKWWAAKWYFTSILLPFPPTTTSFSSIRLLIPTLAAATIFGTRFYSSLRAFLWWLTFFIPISACFFIFMIGRRAWARIILVLFFTFRTWIYRPPFVRSQQFLSVIRFIVWALLLKTSGRTISLLSAWGLTPWWSWAWWFTRNF